MIKPRPLQPAEKKNLRLMALAVQLYGANSTATKLVLERPGFNLNPAVPEKVQAQALALTVQAEEALEAA